MITNPKDFFQQVQNLVEEVALKIKAISTSLSSYLTKADAEATYLDKTEASNTYLGKSETATRATVADSATSAGKATNDANGNNISNTYLKSTTAASTYVKQSDADSKYLGKTAKAESAKTADTATSATSAGSATKAIQDGDGNVISGTYLKSTTAQSTYLSKVDASSTYLTKSDASSTYLGKTAKAASATTADSATKATQDGNGKNIAQTYVKTVNNVAPVNGNVQIELPNNEGLIPKTGDRGALAGYAQVAYAGDFIEGTSVYVDEHFPDSVLASKSYDIFLNSPEEFGRSWTKVIVCNAVPSSIKMSSAYWMWTGEATPTLERPGYLVCHWAGTIGVATYVHTYEYVDPEWPV